MTLEELWVWAYAEGRSATLDVPDRLHARHPYPESDADLPERLSEIRRPTAQAARPAAIVGPPFARAFVRYLDGGRAMTPIRRALFDLRPRGRPSLEYRVLWAIVESGYPSLEALAVIERCSVEPLRSAADRALALLWAKTEKLLSQEPKRVALNPPESVGSVMDKRGRTGKRPASRRSPRHRTGRV